MKTASFFLWLVTLALATSHSDKWFHSLNYHHIVKARQAHRAAEQKRKLANKGKHVWDNCWAPHSPNLVGRKITKACAPESHLYKDLKGFAWAIYFRADGTYTSNEEYKGCITTPGFQEGTWQVCGRQLKLTATKSAAKFIVSSTWTFSSLNFREGEPFSVVTARGILPYTIKSSATVNHPKSEIEKCRSFPTPGNQFTDAGGTWELVRHIPPGEGAWNPRHDALTGSLQYGGKRTGDTHAPAFSAAFQNQDYDQILFATGNFAKWLIVNKEHLKPGRGARILPAFSSSSSPDHKEKQTKFRVGRLRNFPAIWLCQNAAVTSLHSCRPELLYAEKFHHQRSTYTKNNGVDVYIRKRLQNVKA